MKRLMLNALALLVISGGSAHLYAYTEEACCTAASGAKCCGDKCRAGQWSCCADAACDVQPT